jgi:hypothetical protein
VWILRSDPPRNQIGFVPARKLKSEAARADPRFQALLRQMNFFG